MITKETPMAAIDNAATDENAADSVAALRKAGTGFLRYVADNPLAAIAGALIVGAILARFAFLGNPKEPK
jgi:hypothetical protein